MARVYQVGNESNYAECPGLTMVEDKYVYTIDSKGYVKLISDRITGEDYNQLVPLSNSSKFFKVYDTNILNSLMEITEYERPVDPWSFDSETGKYDPPEISQISTCKIGVAKVKLAWDFFYFLSENTDVEWRLNKMKDQSFSIGTSHQSQDSPTDKEFGIKRVNLETMIHSHPRPTTHKGAMKGLDSDGTVVPSYSQNNTKFYVYMKNLKRIYYLKMKGEKVVVEILDKNLKRINKSNNE